MQATTIEEVIDLLENIITDERKTGSRIALHACIVW